MRPHWKQSDINIVLVKVEGQSTTFSITLPDYLAAMRYPQSFHNCIQFCLENNILYNNLTIKKIEIIESSQKTKSDPIIKNMKAFIDAKNKIINRICNNQVIPFHEPWILRQLSPDQRYEYGYIGIKDDKNFHYIFPKGVDLSLRTREDKEWEKIHNNEYIYKIVKRAINQTYWNDGDETEIKMDISFSTNIVISLTFPQIIVACEYPELYFEYLRDYTAGKKTRNSNFQHEAFLLGYLINDKCKIIPKGKISYFEPIDSLSDFETLGFADRIKFLSIEAYSKWLKGEPVPEYKADIEREKRIKQREMARLVDQLQSFDNLVRRIEFYEKAIENMNNFTEEQLKIEINKSLCFWADLTYTGDSEFDQKKENLLELMKTALNVPVLKDLMLNSYNELKGKLDDSLANAKSEVFKKDVIKALKKLKCVGENLGIEKNSEQSKCCYLI